MSDAGKSGGVVFGSMSRGLDMAKAETVFQLMEERLDAIVRAPVVAKDPVAQQLLAELARNPDIETLIAVLEQLDARITELRQRRGTATPIPSESNERARRHVLRL